MTIKDVYIIVTKQFGFPKEAVDTPAILSPEDRTKLFDYSSAYVANNPEKFDPRQVEIAKRHVAAWGTNTPLNDPSFDWGMFAEEVGNNVVSAVEDVSGIGQGVLSFAKAMRWIIPALGIGVLVYVVYKRAK